MALEGQVVIAYGNFHSCVVQVRRIVLLVHFHATHGHHDSRRGHPMCGRELDLHRVAGDTSSWSVEIILGETVTIP